MDYFELIAHVKVTYTVANRIANVVDAGLSLASVMTIASGVGSIVSMFWFAIKNVLITSSKAVLISC